MTEPEAVATSALIAALTKIFKPSAPTDDRDLFRGRKTQLGKLTSVTQEEGQHLIVFGERGVGKTSLANMGMGVFRGICPSGIAVRITCGADDTFASVWKGLVARVQRELDTAAEDVRASLMGTLDRVEDIFMDDPTPATVSRALHLLASRTAVFVVIDEFDRLDGYRYSDRFADLIKQLSDDIIPCTLCFVGVADNVSELIAGHASIDRSLRQVAMPRMSTEELCEITLKGFSTFVDRTGFEISVDRFAALCIATLSQGFPYYTHLLASAVGKRAIYDNVHSISVNDVLTALLEAAEDAEPSIKDSYRTATMAARKDATFDKTILACALAKEDHLGYFAASDVRAPLSQLSGADRPNSSFNSHLKKFSGEHPYILEVTSNSRTARYRFRNPLMKPFVLMRGYNLGMLDTSVFANSN